MKKTITIIAFCIASVGFITAVISSSEQWGEIDEDRYKRDYEAEDDDYAFLDGLGFRPRADVALVENAVYSSECGSCHFAYQPGLLPADAWEQIIGQLDDHYGDNASTDERQAAGIRDHLVENASDRADLSRSQAFSSVQTTANLLPRITQTRFFRHEHHEIPERYVTANEDVRSFSNCQACHRNADAGVYDEHQVFIPGVGRWDD